MNKGNWVPICKALVQDLPNDRRYTRLEAMFSLAVNYDNNRPFSISGLAKLWGWSRSAVRNFLSEIGVILVYEGGISKNSPRGQVGLQVEDKLRTSRGQVEFIDYRQLQGDEDKLRTSRGQVEDKSPSTNNDPDPEPDKKPSGGKQKKFHPPTAGEVSSYCSGRNNGIDAQRFVDYYTATGWMIGKNKMKDWKAAVRTWEGKRKEDQSKFPAASMSRGAQAQAVLDEMKRRLCDGEMAEGGDYQRRSNAALPAPSGQAGGGRNTEDHGNVVDVDFKEAREIDSGAG